MNEYMKLYIRNWLNEFEEECIRNEGRARHPMAESEFQQFANDFMLEATEQILGK